MRAIRGSSVERTHPVAPGEALDDRAGEEPSEPAGTVAGG